MTSLYTRGLTTKLSEYESYRDNLVEFANSLGYTVQLNHPMPQVINDVKEKLKGTEKYDDLFDGQGNLREGKECRPAGYCNYHERLIVVREGKSVKGQVATLIHEIAHALGLGGNSFYSYLGEGYIELAAESITEIVTQKIGLNRTHKTAPRIMGYGFYGFLESPLTYAVSSVILQGMKEENG